MIKDMVSTVVRKVTLEFVYEIVDKRTAEIRNDVMELRSDVSGLRSEMNRRFEAMDHKFDAANGRIDTLNTRLDSLSSEMNRRFDQVILMLASRGNGDGNGAKP